MAKRNTSIKINGKHYDALSGADLNFEQVPVKHASKSIDGVVGGKSTTVTSPTKTAAEIKVAKRSSANHINVKRPTASKTLMRHAVAKPEPTLKSRTKVVAATHHASHAALLSTPVSIVPKISLSSVNPQRVKRAASTPTHHRVSRFSREASLVVADIKQAAEAIDKAIVIPKTYNEAYRPDIRRVKVITNGQPMTSDIFEQALLRATSHEETEPELPRDRSRLRSLRRRMVSFTAGAFAVLALVGFVGFQKQDQVHFKVAATKTSFSARMPGYQPQGFEVAGVTSSSDFINLKYTSGERQYSILERQSNLNSDSLLETLTVGNNVKTYAAVQASGKTVYLYGLNQAAWVHNGVLYQVLGNGALSTKDFTQIASSM